MAHVGCNWLLKFIGGGACRSKCCGVKSMAFANILRFSIAIYAPLKTDVLSQQQPTKQVRHANGGVLVAKWLLVIIVSVVRIGAICEHGARCSDVRRNAFIL